MQPRSEASRPAGVRAKHRGRHRTKAGQARRGQRVVTRPLSPAASSWPGGRSPSKRGSALCARAETRSMPRSRPPSLSSSRPPSPRESAGSAAWWCSTRRKAAPPRSTSMDGPADGRPRISIGTLWRVGSTGMPTAGRSVATSIKSGTCRSSRREPWPGCGPPGSVTQACRGPIWCSRRSSSRMTGSRFRPPLPAGSRPVRPPPQESSHSSPRSRRPRPRPAFS